MGCFCRDEVPCQAGQVRVDAFSPAHRLNAADGGDLALIIETSALFPDVGDEFVKAIIDFRNEVRGRARCHSVSNISPVDDDYVRAASSGLIG